MKAITFQGVKALSFDSIADPTLEQSSDAIVQVEVAGICGSDLHVYRGRETGLDAGTVMGHEFAGKIRELGSDVSDLQMGDRVVSPFTTTCGTCFYCRSGLTSRCEEGELFGWREGHLGLHGVQAEFVRVPLAESTLVRVPPECPLDHALFAGDVLATAYFGADLAAVHPGSTVIILGCGPVGLMAILAARQRSATTVYAVDPVASRRQLAERFGAVALSPGDELQGQVLEATDGRGADAVVEAVGTPEATRLAANLLRPGGTIAALGVHTEPEFALAPGEIYDKNLTYRAGRCPARAYMDELLPLIAEGRFPLDDLISHRLPLSEGIHGYEMFDNRQPGCTKVLLNPGG